MAIEEIPRAVPWILTALSGLGNIAQMINTWRRGGVDVKKIQQDMTVQLVEKMHALSDAQEERNGDYITRLATEKEEMLTANQRLRAEVGQLRRRVTALEAQDKARAAHLRMVEDELRAWQEQAP